MFTEETGWQKDYAYFYQQTEYTQNFCRIIQANVLRTFGVDMLNPREDGCHLEKGCQLHGTRGNFSGL